MGKKKTKVVIAWVPNRCKELRSRVISFPASGYFSASISISSKYECFADCELEKLEWFSFDLKMSEEALSLSDGSAAYCVCYESLLLRLFLADRKLLLLLRFLF